MVPATVASSQTVIDSSFCSPISTTSSPGRTEPQEVTLAVYDVFGRLVATLVDAFKPAGTYEARFVAHGLASGIYFYRFQAGRFGETKTMLLVK